RRARRRARRGSSARGGASRTARAPSRAGSRSRRSAPARLPCPWPSPAAAETTGPSSGSAPGRTRSRSRTARRSTACPPPGRRWQRAHELIAVARVENEDAAGLEGAPETVHHQAILVVGEVADRAEQIHGQIESARELHVADVLADEREAHLRVAGGLTGAL